ncbi:serine/threonine-protein kinase [Agromyces ramosus]|uniref:non-specific serine/threonine protein kinase n=1 Tax=Agromyces ramosus TaxID=33879 RepID=A0ABU0R4K5_9MICO|nr:serine/threonine-protein kinase [Agromyces ramosus]MDQ0892692.1 serine/threonine protein kinase [Agromyces ramosus]
MFLYEQRLPRRKVAVKVLLAEGLERDTKAQFVAEANLMAQLSAHPFIVTIFHADVAADGRPYFVMEYCSGPSLAERYKRGRFAVEDALRTGVRLAGAVATAHGAGILHRDIKPANVLTNDYGWPALTDFGISSNLEGELPVHTITGRDEASGTGSGQSAVGMSVPWSPAEMFEDDPKPDTRSDVFSLAATVYTLLAGRTPFEIAGRSNGSLDLIGRIERGAITPLDRDDVPRSLSVVLAKGMAKRRDDRYQSAVDFARALQRVELELGYAATTIEVPNLATERHGSATGEVDPDAVPDADATRARSVQVVDAQSARAVSPVVVPGDDDATRARSPQRVDPQPVAASAAPTQAPLDDRTVVRTHGRAASAPVDAGASVGAADGVTDVTIVRTPSAVGADAAAPSRSETPAPRRRPAIGTVIGAVAGVVVLAAVGLVIALSGTLSAPEPSAKPTTTPDDAVVAVTVPAPTISPGVPGADGASVVFEVSHDPVEDGDLYRWQRADGIGSTQVAEGPSITVTGATPGVPLCIDVQVQRGSKTSEPQRGCSS